MKYPKLDKRNAENPLRIKLIITLVCSLSLLGWAPRAESQHRETPPVSTSFLKTPLSFEANVGQVDAPVHYLSRGPGYGIFLTSTEAVLVVHRPTSKPPTDFVEDSQLPLPVSIDTATLHFRFVGNEIRNPLPMGHDRLHGKSHYFLGKDPSGWHSNVPHFARVVYGGLYPGIDLIYYGKNGQLEYDLVVAPGANPQDILLEIQGAERLRLLPEGALSIETNVGEVRHHKPVIYQEQDGVTQPVAGAYLLQGGNRISFEIGEYDTTRPLYIDPVISYSSYIPSNGVYGLAIDQDNNIYLTGATLPFVSFLENSLIFDPRQRGTPRGYLNIFVSKFDPTGRSLIYSVFLGGEWDDQGRDIAVDEDGNAYVVGFSSSTNFPTVNPLQFENPDNPESSGFRNSGSYDVVIAKLSPSGDTLEYATYLGGCGEDGFIGSLAMAMDEERNVYLTGSTNSPDFPIVNAFQPTYGRRLDTFVTKIGPQGGSLVYSTFLGGTSSDLAGDMEVDDEGHVYVVGTTSSRDFPTMNAFQAELAQMPAPEPGEPIRIFEDIFLTKFQPDGTGLVYSTYLGGESTDQGHGLALNRSGQAFITGNTRSDEFPGAPKEDRPRRQADVFVSQFSASGTSLLNSTVLGGSGGDFGLAIALEGNRRAWVTGLTFSVDFPITETAPQRSIGTLGTPDAFVLQLSVGSPSPDFSTYLGGDSYDTGLAIEVRTLEVPPNPPSPGVFPEELTSTVVVGLSRSSDFPRTAAQQPLPSGGFVVDFLESENPQEFEERFPCPPFCFPIPLPNPPFLPTTFPPPQADLTITLEDSPAPVLLGESLDYTVTVTNKGPDPTSGVIVTDILPAQFLWTNWLTSQGFCRGDPFQLVCELGPVGVDNEATITISGIPVAAGIALTNGAGVFSDLPDPDYTNNSVKVVTEVTDPNAPARNNPIADLSVIKNDVFLNFDLENGDHEIDTSDDEMITDATFGEPFIYEIKVKNAEEVAIIEEEMDEEGKPIQKVKILKTDPATDVILTDFLPFTVSLGSYSVDPPQGDCFGFFELRCYLGTLEPGAEVTVTMRFIASSLDDILFSGDIRNVALVTTSVTEPAGGASNSDFEDTAVNVPQSIEAADLLVALTDEEESILDDSEEDEKKPDPVDSDQNSGRGEVTWRLAVFNSGPDKALDVKVASRMNVMEIDGIPPTTTVHLDSIPPTPFDKFEDREGKDNTGIRHFKPMKGKIKSEDDLDPNCQNGNTTDDEDCEVDGRFECTFCEEFSPLCAICKGQECSNMLEAFRTQELPSGKIRIFSEDITPEDIIPKKILSEIEDNEVVLSCTIGTLQSAEKFLLDFSLDLTQGIHTSTANATTLTFDPESRNDESVAGTTVAVPPGHPPRGGVGGDETLGKGCFIATAAFGSPLAKEVRMLKQFRDQILLSFGIGHFLVKTYYATSPPLAAFISEKPWLKLVVRIALWPAVWWAQLTLLHPYFGMTVLLLGLLFSLSLFYGIIRISFRPHSLSWRNFSPSRVKRV